MGYFNVTDIIKDTPERLWKRYHSIGFITYDDFIDYYKGHDVGYGIMVREFIRFSTPLYPKQHDPSFRAPQSYCYIDNVETISWFINLVRTIETQFKSRLVEKNFCLLWLSNKKC